MESGLHTRAGATEGHPGGCPRLGMRARGSQGAGPCEPNLQDGHGLRGKAGLEAASRDEPGGGQAREVPGGRALGGQPAPGTHSRGAVGRAGWAHGARSLCVGSGHMCRARGPGLGPLCAGSRCLAWLRGLGWVVGPQSKCGSSHCLCPGTWGCRLLLPGMDEPQSRPPPPPPWVVAEACLCPGVEPAGHVLAAAGGLLPASSARPQPRAVSLHPRFLLVPQCQPPSSAR